MDSLPREILENIFSRLSKRYKISVCSTVCKTWQQLILKPSFYSTIHFYSQQQLIKFIKLAKENTINNKPIGHYVQHLIFHYNYLRYKNVLLAIANTLPNIHSISGPTYGVGRENNLSENDDSQYQQLTHIDLWFTLSKRTWMKTLLNNKEKVESLFIPGIIQTVHSRYPLPLPPIHFKPFGQLSTSTLPSYTSCYSLGFPQREILVLPTMNQLTSLCIYFPRIGFPNREKYSFFDEYTFESIHQSCPCLVSLSLQFLYMTIPEDKNDEENTSVTSSSTDNITQQNDINIAMFQKAYHLKELEISGIIMDANCFTYFSKKYPQLESLKLNLQVLAVPTQIIKPFQFAIHSMMTHFQFLKKLNLELKYFQHEMDELLKIGLNDKVFWPNDEFLDWLLQFPTQLTHFTYYNEMLEKWNQQVQQQQQQQQQRFLNNNPGSTAIINNYYQTIINKIIHQPNALFNHLIYLKLTTKLSRDILYHFILQQKNENNIVLSLSIMELVIYGLNEDKSEGLVCITDWLDVFPNLTLLKLKAIGLVNDGEDLNKEDHDFTLRNKDNIYVRKSHEMIKQRKQYQQLDLSYSKNDSNYAGINSNYKLKHLTLQQCTLSMKNGLNGILKKCPHLKSLVLDTVLHSFLEPDSLHNDNGDTTSSTLLPRKEMTFDLSQYQLELLVIQQLSFIPWGKYIYNDSYIVNKLLIHEITPDNKRIITRSGNTVGGYKGEYTLPLKCKYIDELIFNKEN
ncbi:unnamed protein product [Cunninghamella echinulata]